MKILSVLVGLLLMGGVAQASTLTWNRNSELGAKDYQVYVCTVPGCTVTKVPAMLVATVPQPIVGDVPTFVLDLTGKTGQVAVTARNLALMESGLSNVVSFAFPVPIPTNHITSKNLDTDHIEVLGLVCRSLKTTGTGLKRIVTCVP